MIPVSFFLCFSFLIPYSLSPSGALPYLALLNGRTDRQTDRQTDGQTDKHSLFERGFRPLLYCRYGTVRDRYGKVDIR